MSGEFAGCEALCAEQAADEIRSIVAGREASGNNDCVTGCQLSEERLAVRVDAMVMRNIEVA